jgi:hypothetical protein
MPTGLRMYIRLDKLPQDFSLAALRHEFVQAFSFDVEDDFYIEGPLMLMGEADRSYMPVKDEHSIWLNVNLWKSYYGVGYERGDPELFVQCAEWAEKRLPGCQIYYGHDVNDENVSLFDKSAREKLMKYYRMVGHKPYRTESSDERKDLQKNWEQINDDMEESK